MTREEYIRRLNEQLSFLPSKARAAAVAFYTEMLDDRMEDGMDEAGAVAAMEAPGDIAARLQAEGGEEWKEAEETAADFPLHVGIRDEALEFASLADSALRGIEEAVKADKKEEEFRPAAEPVQAKETEETDAQPEPDPQPDPQPRPEPSSWQETVSSALEAANRAMADAGVQQQVSDALKTAKEAVRQAGREIKSEVSREAEKQAEQAKAQAYRDAPDSFERREIICSAEEINAVNIDVINMPVRILPAQDDRFTLIYYTSDWAPYIAQAEGGVLTLRSLDKGRKTGFASFITSGLKMIFSQSSPPAELYVPAGALPDVQVHTSNGSIRAEGAKGLCQVTLTTSNSRISVKDVTCKAFRAQTSNSRLEMEKLESKTTVWGQSSNARIEARNVRAGKEITCKTSNSQIQLLGVAAGGLLSAATSNGAIHVGGLSAPGISLRTSNGTVGGVLPGRAADWRITSGTSNGSNSLPTRQDGVKPLEVRTSNGNIKLGFELP